jgi:hypothetical protein
VKAITTLSSLSPEEKNFLKNKQIVAANTPDGWIGFLRKLKQIDDEGDKTRKRSFSIGCLGLAATVVGIILLFIGISIWIIPIGILIIPIGVLITAIAYGIYFYLKSYDIPGSILSHTLVPMLMILREEMKPDEQIKLRLDLRGFSIPEKLVKTSPSYSRGAYYKIVDSFYRDHWLDGDTVLADGTRLIWSIEDLVKSSKKTKRNASNKHKTKTKDKHQSVISLQVGMYNKRYSFPPKIKQKTAEGAIRTRDADRYSWMMLRKVIKHQGEQTFTPADFINAVAGAYARAVPAGGRK